MRKVIKSYMISFVKSWVETLGTIIFLLTLTAIVVGMLASPLQINLKTSKYNKGNGSYDIYLKNKAEALNDDFIFRYFISAVDKDGNNTEIKMNYNKTLTTHGNLFSDAWLKEYAEEHSDHQQPNVDMVRKVIDQIDKGNLVIPELKKGNLKGVCSVFSPYYASILNGKACDGSNTNVAKYHLRTGIMDSIQLDIFNNFRNDKNRPDIAIQPSIYFEVSKDGIDKGYELRSAYGSSDFYKAYKDGDKGPLDYKDSTTNINKLVLDEGRNIQNQNEVVLSKKYARINNLKLGDEFSLPVKYNNQNPLKLKIVGLGEEYDALVPNKNFSTNNGIENFTYAYVDPQIIEKVWNENIKVTDKGMDTDNNSMKYSMIKRVTSSKDINIMNMFKFDSVKYEGLTPIFAESSSIYKSYDSYNGIQALTQIKIQVIIYIVLGVIVLALSFLFINFVIKKEINQTRVQLGIFKAFGYTTNELSWIFSLKTFITIFIGVFIGYFLSFPIQTYVSKQFAQSVIIDFDVIYHGAGFIIGLIFGIPAIFTLVSYLLTLNYLRESALSLISNMDKFIKKPIFISIMSWIIWPIGVTSLIRNLIIKGFTKKNIAYTYRMRHAFTQRSIGKYTMIVSLFTFSAFLFSLQLSATTVMNGVINQAFGAFNDKIDHTYNFDPKILIDGEDGKLKIQNKENIQTWNNEVKYLDYSKIGLDKYKSEQDSLQEVRDVTTFVAASMYGANIKQLSFMWLGAMLFTPLSFESGNKYDINNPKDVEAFKEKYITNAMPEWANIIKEITDNPNDNAIKQKYLATLSPDETHEAIYMKDLSRFTCLTTQSFSQDENATFSNCNDPANWSFNVPDSGTGGSGGGSGGESDDHGALNKLGENATLLLSTTMMLDQSPSYDPIISINNFLYNSQKDSLTYSLDGTIVEKSAITDVKLQLSKIHDIYGDIKNEKTLKGVTDKQLDALKDKNDSYVNAVISYRLAKGLNIGIGDEFHVKSTTNKPIEYTIKVTGVDMSNTFGSDILLDYDTFSLKYFPELTEDKSKSAIFSDLASTGLSVTGGFNFSDKGSSLQNLKIKDETFNFTMYKQNSIFLSMFNFDKLINSIIPSSRGISMGDITQILDLLNKLPDNNAKFLTAASMTNIGNKFMPFKIIKALVNKISNISSTMMILFMVLDSFLLLVILVVIMNIVVDEAARVILTMRAIGYKESKINWMVMGNYVIGALIGFVVSYVLTMISWQIISAIIWKQYAMIIPSTVDLKTPLITFLVLGSIMFAGWVTAMLRINKKPLTNITAV